MVVYEQGNRSRAAYPLIFFGGANPPDERKEGDADEHYILGFNQKSSRLGLSLFLLKSQGKSHLSFQ